MAKYRWNCDRECTCLECEYYYQPLSGNIGEGGCYAPKDMFDKKKKENMIQIDNKKMWEALLQSSWVNKDVKEAIRCGLKDQGLEYKDGEIINADFTIEGGKYYMCIRNSYRAEGIEFIKGKVYFATDDYKMVGEFEEVEVARDNTEQFFRLATEEETEENKMRLVEGRWYMCVRDYDPLDGRPKLFKKGKVYKAKDSRYMFYRDDEARYMGEGLPYYFRYATEKEILLDCDWSGKIGSKHAEGKLKEMIDEKITEDLQGDFEQEIEACKSRYPEVSFAKMSRIAKRFYDLGKKIADKEHEAELECAYKNADEVQYKHGYEVGYGDCRKEIIDKFIDKIDIDEMVSGFNPTADDTLESIYRKGIEDTLRFIKGE